MRLARNAVGADVVVEGRPFSVSNSSTSLHRGGIPLEVTAPVIPPPRPPTRSLGTPVGSPPRTPCSFLVVLFWGFLRSPVKSPIGVTSPVSRETHQLNRDRQVVGAGSFRGSRWHKCSSSRIAVGKVSGVLFSGRDRQPDLAPTFGPFQEHPDRQHTVR